MFLVGGLKNQPIWKICASQIGWFPKIFGMNIKDLWNHHPVPVLGFQIKENLFSEVRVDVARPTPTPLCFFKNMPPRLGGQILKITKKTPKGGRFLIFRGKKTENINSLFVDAWKLNKKTSNTKKKSIGTKKNIHTSTLPETNSKGTWK